MIAATQGYSNGRSSTLPLDFSPPKEESQQPASIVAFVHEARAVAVDLSAEVMTQFLVAMAERPKTSDVIPNLAAALRKVADEVERQADGVTA